MDLKMPKLSSEFHLSIVSKCCQICGEFQESRASERSLLDSELKKVFPGLTARGLGSRPSQLTCAACYAMVHKFRRECRTNLLASRNMSKEEKLAVLVSTRFEGKFFKKFFRIFPIQFLACFRDSHHLPDSLFNFPEHLELEGCEFCQKFEARVQMLPVGSLFLNKTVLLASSVRSF
jgi:hypothetical protein